MHIVYFSTNVQEASQGPHVSLFRSPLEET